MHDVVRKRQELGAYHRLILVIQAAFVNTFVCRQHNSIHWLMWLDQKLQNLVRIGVSRLWSRDGRTDRQTDGRDMQRLCGLTGPLTFLYDCFTVRKPTCQQPTRKPTCTGANKLINMLSLQETYQEKR